MISKTNKNNQYSYILDKSNYNEFFQFYSKELEYYGLHKILTDYFPLYHEPSGVIVKYFGYKCDYNKYNEKIFTSSYLSHTAKLYFQLEFTIFNPELLDSEIAQQLYDKTVASKKIIDDFNKKSKKYKENIENAEVKVFDYMFTVANIPIKIGKDSYFVVNGTKKIMIYQLVKTGGFYYQIDKEVNDNLKYLDSGQVGPVSLVRLVSLSGSRVVIKVNRRGILQTYVNNSEKIKIATFFDLIPEEKLLRYIKFYKSELNVTLFETVKSNVVKHALLFADAFDFEITNKGAYVNCTKEQMENYLIAKWNRYSYCENKKLMFIPLNDLYNCIIAKKNKCSFTNKKNKQIEIKEGGVITDALKSKILLLDDNTSINVTLLCFVNSMNIICRSFLHYIDKDIIENLETTEQETEKSESDEDYDSDDESEGYKSSNINEDYEDNEESSSTSISYVIDEMIRKRINKYLNVKYSEKELKFTEEDFILTFILFNKMMLEDHEKKDYDALDYKIVKCPETFISNLIMRAIKKLQNNLKYLGNTKIKKYENSDTEGSNTDDYADLKHIINEFLSAYSVSSDIRKLFGGTYPIVQFLEETNILSVWSHTRRISVFNLVNSDKHQASFEGRDINPTYFGKICPTETPEGRNVGLVNSLALNALISEYGFILTPYYVVENGKITNNVHLLTSEDEKDKVMACFQKDFEKQDKVLCRYNGESCEMERSKVNYIDYNNCSMLSIASCLIPGIQHNDARRALMGANMQRQALPLIRKEAPIVGTGVEHLVIKYSNNVIYNKKTKPRLVISASSVSVITVDKETMLDFEVFHIDRFMKTNMKTCNHMTTLVKKGDILENGDAIASGSCIDKNELAIGQNVKVAITSIYGYEFEDSVLISDYLKEKGAFASIHMSTTEVKAKEVNELREIITKDKIEKVRKIDYLDDRGIIKVGTKINFKNEIIVGRGIPRTDNPSLEDGVLSVIFGQDIPEYKDISARSNEEFSGVVTDIHYFNKLTNVQDSTYCTHLTDSEIYAQKQILKTVIEKFITVGSEKYYKQINDAEDLESIGKILVALQKKKIDGDKKQKMQKVIDYLKERTDNHEKVIKMSKCCNPENNVTEYVKITTTEKRVIEPGDKVSGRHGNKGVISHIMARENMPFTDEGEIVDIAINPIGIPNRLNLAQILESALGRTSYELSKQVRVSLRCGKNAEARKLLEEYLKFKVHRDPDLDVDKCIEIIENDGFINLKLPVFDSISFDELKDILKLLGISEDATVRLNCGITGEPFNRKVHMGDMYLMKLNHTAKEKKSVRETGGYSAILEQPLPRKSNYGGQRFGEMEVWAVEAHGAAHTLLEILGPKSDNTTARNKLYQSIFTRGYRWTKDVSEDSQDTENYEDKDLGLSATVNVLIKYLNGVCIKLQFIKRLGKAIEQNNQRNN